MKIPPLPNPQLSQWAHLVQCSPQRFLQGDPGAVVVGIRLPTTSWMMAGMHPVKMMARVVRVMARVSGVVKASIASPPQIWTLTVRAMTEAARPVLVGMSTMALLPVDSTRCRLSLPP